MLRPDKEEALSHERLLAYLHYDPETGHFTRKTYMGANGNIGDRVGGVWVSKRSPTHKYWYISVDHHRYQAHRLAVFYMTGKWPAYNVDHIDHDGLNNRWANLREASQRQNLQNTRLCVRNTSGVKGVSWSQARKKWVAQITINGKRTPLGRYFDKQDAIAAYQTAATRHFGEFACLQ